VKRFTHITFLAAVLLTLTAVPTRVLACATCYGASDSPLAQGMNWGIVTLLAFVGLVLGSITVFFVHIGRRSARFNSAEQSQNSTDQQT